MPYQHLIFDLDGTLLNTLDDLAVASNYVCARHGWPTFERDAFRHKVGNGLQKLAERIMPPELISDTDLVKATFQELSTYYQAHSLERTAPYSGILPMLDELGAQNLTLAVLTNKDHAAAQTLVSHFFGTGRFTLIQGQVPDFPPKPDAPVTLHTMAQLHAHPETTIYVGDSDVDVACAHNAGLKIAAVAWGFRSRAELELAGADFIATTPDELIALIVQV